jgi:hypothetical protein
MSSTGRGVIIEFWHFRCPECGLGDAEFGYHARSDMILCEICLEEGQHVRLKRWAADDSGPLARDSG